MKDNTMKIKIDINPISKSCKPVNDDLHNRNKNTISFEEYQQEVANRLSWFVFLKWRNKKTYNMVKKIYNKRYSISDCVSLIIINS